MTRFMRLAVLALAIGVAAAFAVALNLAVAKAFGEFKAFGDRTQVACGKLEETLKR